MHTQARAQEPAITRTLSGIAENLGTRLRDPDKQLCSIKSLQDHLADHLAALGGKFGKTPEQQVHNALRYIMVFPQEHFTQRTQTALTALQNAGFGKTHLLNHLLHDNPLFRGVSIVLATEEEFTFTVQFHTPASYQAKIDNHDTYKNNQQEARQTNPDLTRLQAIGAHCRNGTEEAKSPSPNTSASSAILRR